MLSRARLLALVSLCALAPLVLSGCANTLQDEPIEPSFLEPLVMQDKYPVYWLGGSFHALGIVSVARDPSEAYTIKYGDCREGGENVCVTPLEIVTSPDNSFYPGGTAARRPGRARGIPIVTAQEGKTIVLPTGPVVVDIYADSASLARAAAQAMVTINGAQLPGAPLPRALPESGFGQKPLVIQRPSIAPLAPAAANGE